MKRILLLAALLLPFFFVSCDPDDSAKNSVTVNGQTYNDVDAYYFQEGHFFDLRLVLGADRKTTAYGVVDTPIALGEDLKGRTVTIDKDFGYGDRMSLQVSYSGGDFYDATPASGKQTFKKVDGTHYRIILDTKDENGKPYKMNVIAEQTKVK